MKYNERVRHLETHNALNTLWQQCCPQEIRKQFRKMKWVKRAVTGNKGCGSASKWRTVSCAWELQPLGVGGKPANKFERITTECFLWNAEDIYITLSAPLISCAKTEWLSLFSCLKRVIFHHTFQKIHKADFRKRSWSFSLQNSVWAMFWMNLKFSCFVSFYWWLTGISFLPLRNPWQKISQRDTVATFQPMLHMQF